MIGYILTAEQKTQIQGVYFSQFQFFSCIQDINNTWFLFLSNQDKTEISQTEFSWILNLEQADFTPKPSFP